MSKKLVRCSEMSKETPFSLGGTTTTTFR